LTATLKTYFPHDDSTLFGSFPGAGPALAPRLLAAFGSNRDRFEFAAEMQQLSGIAPVTEKSGEGIWIHWRLACSKFLRQTFHEFAGRSIAQSDWARAYYDQQRKRGKSHQSALRALAFKWGYASSFAAGKPERRTMKPCTAKV
jgi:hypothetical protein